MPAIYVTHSHTIGKLAVPLILTNFAYVAIATVDLVMLGTLSALDLAAGGLAIALFNQLRTMGTGLVTATGNLVAGAAGRKDYAAIPKLLNASFIWASVVALVFIVLMGLLETPLVLLGQDPEVAAKTVDYLTIVAIGMLPCLWFQSVRHFSVGLKAPGPLLMITLMAVTMTILLNYGLIFGAWGLPALGFIGVAVTTLCVLIFSFIAFIFIALRHPVLGPYIHWKWWETDRESIMATWKMGLPIAATYGSEAGFFTLLMLLVGSLGVHELAAHTVVNQLVYITFMISAGISSAASICISEAYAQQKFLRARELGIAGMWLGTIATAIIAVPYLLVPHWVLFPFMSAEEMQNSSILNLAISLLAIAAFLQVFDAGQNIGLGILRGIGDVKSPLQLSILGYWIIGLPAAWGACYLLDLSIQGVWYGLMLGLAVTALLQLILFLVKASPPKPAPSAALVPEQNI
ncbi:MAG: family efflux transporter [Cellvibrio sp.]|nr:family efflux transporter [Cellvibrio sp.]